MVEIAAVVRQRRSLKTLALAVACAVLLPIAARGLGWSQPVRGSWVRPDSRPQAGDVTLAGGGSGCEIVVGSDEHSAVAQAARFLASDIEKISGYKPAIVAQPSGQRVAIRLMTLAGARGTPPGIARQRLDGQWEAYQIRTMDNAIWLVGSNFRGTAFAAYTLSERIGIDPLYIWTGYAPAKLPTLVVKPIDFIAEPPTFKFRGFFHDDEDILPRPFDEHGYPLQTGTVPRIWYERFFETALRLRMNMVAPYVRVQRPYERNRAPCAAAPLHRSDQHVAPNRRMRMTDVARQHAHVPVGVLWQREKEVGVRAADAERRDAAVRGPEELARVAERVPQRLVWLADVFQVGGQAVDELQRGEFPLYRQHAASGWCSSRRRVKCDRRATPEAGSTSRPSQTRPLPPARRIRSCQGGGCCCTGKPRNPPPPDTAIVPTRGPVGPA